MARLDGDRGDLTPWVETNPTLGITIRYIPTQPRVVIDLDRAPKTPTRQRVVLPDNAEALLTLEDPIAEVSPVVGRVVQEYAHQVILRGFVIDTRRWDHEARHFCLTGQVRVVTAWLWSESAMPPWPVPEAVQVRLGRVFRLGVGVRETSV